MEVNECGDYTCTFLDEMNYEDFRKLIQGKKKQFTKEEFEEMKKNDEVYDCNEFKNEDGDFDWQIM